MPMKILVVDDEEHQRMLYAQEFEADGYEVIDAENGHVALEKAASERPDIVILDICMPGMDGIEALGKILGADFRIPVVLNTAFGGYRENFMSWAADAYVVKSADLTELKRTVRDILETNCDDAQ
jgi:DNA-binding response OmpR family regulator